MTSDLFDEYGSQPAAVAVEPLAELKTSKRVFMVVRETTTHVFCRLPFPRPIHCDLEHLSQDLLELHNQGYHLCGSSANCLVFSRHPPKDTYSCNNI